jgi:hypothetical protein
MQIGIGNSLSQGSLHRAQRRRFAQRRRTDHSSRDKTPLSAAGSGKGGNQDPDGRKGLDNEKIAPKSSKGNSFEKSDRRKGRPAHLRSPDDTPLRDANRDVMLGVLTARYTFLLSLGLYDIITPFPLMLNMGMHVLLQGSKDTDCISAGNQVSV